MAFGPFSGPLHLLRSKLISDPFEFAGRRYDLRYQIGKGVTQFGTAAATALPPEQTPKDYVSAVAFSGSALALIDG